MIEQVSIVDDDQQVTHLISVIAKKMGYHTQQYNNVDTFLKQPHLKSELVFLDLCMPGTDGVEVIRSLAKQQCPAQIVLISGQEASVLKAARELAIAQNLYCIDALSKPIELKTYQRLLAGLTDPIEKNESRSTKKWNPTKNELAEAIEESQLVLYYQPQIDCKSNILRGVEALVRWQHPERGLIYPVHFIGVAEECGLIGALTTQVIRLAVRDSKHWQAMGLNINVSVNVSADNIRSLSLPEQLSTLVSENEISPSNLTLEITESELMGELVASLDILTRLRMKGFGLSIDDFGTGYSSLSQLHKIPFSELKIDQSFVLGMISDKEAYAIVETCVMLGKKLGMTVVAEGVESQEHQELLAAMNCDISQGYYWEKPMPSKALLPWIAKHQAKLLEKVL